jgi:MFS family permease
MPLKEIIFIVNRVLEKGSPMFAVLRQRNFALFWSGQLISLIGDMLLFVALPFYVFSMTNSALATGIMFIVETLPRLVLSSLAGVFVDRWSRKYTIVVANLVQVIVLAPLLFVHSSETIWLVYVFSFLSSCASQFTVAASGALGPNLVQPDQLLAANSLNSLSMELTRLIGPLLGGVLVGLLGKNVVVLADAASFFCVACMIALVHIPAQTGEAKEQTVRTGPAQLWGEWMAGMKQVRRRAIITAIFITLGTSMIAEGVVQVMLAPWVKSFLHGNELTYGWLAASQAVGGLLGSVLMPHLTRLLKPARLIPLCGVCVGLLVLAVVNTPLLWLAMLFMMLIGFAAIGFFITLFTLIQDNTTDAYRGRVIGAFGTLQALAMLLGMGLASTLGDSVGIVWIMSVAGSCYFLAGLLSFHVSHILNRPATTDLSTPEAGAGRITGELFHERQVSI